MTNPGHGFSSCRSLPKVTSYFLPPDAVFAQCALSTVVFFCELVSLPWVYWIMATLAGVGHGTSLGSEDKIKVEIPLLFIITHHPTVVDFVTAL